MYSATQTPKELDTIDVFNYALDAVFEQATKSEARPTSYASWTINSV